MIYSSWSPTTGEYDYYQAADPQGLNDDLPIPRMPAPTELGVPSVEGGRDLPGGAKHAGSGELARGLITHPAKVQLFGTALNAEGVKSAAMWFVVGALSASLLWAVWRRKK